MHFLFQKTTKQSKSQKKTIKMIKSQIGLVHKWDRKVGEGSERFLHNKFDSDIGCQYPQIGLTESIILLFNKIKTI